MTIRWPWILTLSVLAGVIALAFFYPHEMVSPGNLTAAHADLESDCFACHVPFRGVSSGRCINCHVVADIGLKTTKGVTIAGRNGRPAFHQALTEENCLSCHSEHPAPSYARHPVKTFQHGLIAPATRKQCETCHTAPDDAQHKGLNLPCAQCHQTSGWEPSTFDHAKFFPLTGHHAASCVTCHTGQDFKRYTCFGCHEHERSKVEAQHREEGIRNIDNCVRCHRSGGDGEREHGEREGEDDDD